MSWILAVILRLAATEDVPAPWASTYAETAQAIDDASPNDEMAWTLLAIGWTESRFSPTHMGDCHGLPPSATNCRSHGVFQLSTHWLPPSSPVPQQALVAARLIRRSAHIRPQHPLAWYGCGGPPPFARSCDASSDRVYALVRRLRSTMPQPRHAQQGAVLSQPRQTMAP